MLAPLDLPIEELRGLEAECVRVGHMQVRDRLRMGHALHRLGKRHQELGFRTFAMYVQERASQKPRWCGDTRRLAGRLEERPAIRAGLLSRRVGWSMAELLARHSTPEDEAELLEATRSMTVQQVRRALHERGQGESGEGQASSDEDGFSTFEMSVTRSEWLALEGTRLGIEHVNGGSLEPGHWLECLVFEGASTLLHLRPDLHRFFLNPPEPKRPAEPGEEPPPPAAAELPPLVPFEEEPLPGDAVGLDRVIRECSARIASRDVWLGRLLDRFFRARGWQRLGYASEQQWCDERLGMARSTARSRVTMARRARWLEGLAEAVCDGHLGYEQAALITRVASPDTLPAWIERASERTFKHLREEVRAVELLAQMAADARPGHEPPTPEELEVVFDFERGVRSGQTLARWAGAAPQREDPDDEPEQGELEDDAEPVQMSVGFDGPRVQLSVRARDEVILHYRQLEAAFAASGIEGSFFVFLALCFWQQWGHRFQEGTRWKHVHDRDRHQCVSPVCWSRNVTDHHLKYRAHGGGDEIENQASLCDFCHLDGEHGGRLKVRGTADAMKWWIGRAPILEVHGRQVVWR